MASEIKVNKVSPATGTDLTVGDSGDTVTVPTGVGLTVTDEVKTNKVSPSSGTALQVGDSGDTITVPTGAGLTVTDEVKTNKISPASGTSFTLGDSGDTFTIPSGATITNNGTASGFGGAIEWQTSDVKTSTFTAAAGKGYFVNTTSGSITVNLPAGSAGTQIGLADYAGTWDSNACVVAPNGSEKIEGVTQDVSLTNERESVTIIYQDSTQGWLPISNSDGKITSPQYIVATGGTITTSGNFKIHRFTSTGTFTVTSVGNAIGGGDTVSYEVVAAGGGGGSNSPQMIHTVSLQVMHHQV